MKTLTITLRKPNASATCVVVFRNATWPESEKWSGDRKAFRLGDGGSVPKFSASLGHVAEDVEFQAAQCGAVFTLDDDGGAAPMRIDGLGE